MVWLFTTTKKDGWIEMKWLCGVRKFGFPTCVLLRQNLSAHFRQFQGTYWWRCSQHQNWTKNNYRRDSWRRITKKLQPLDISVNFWRGEGGLGAIFRFFSLLSKDALENLSWDFYGITQNGTSVSNTLTWKDGWVILIKHSKSPIETVPVQICCPS